MRTHQDNCRFHRFFTGELVEHLMGMYGVRVVFFSLYSPDLNPIELAFKFHLRRSSCDNIRTAPIDAWNQMDAKSVYCFFHHCGYVQ